MTLLNWIKDRAIHGSQLAFRGGMALHKLYLAPQPRYSEDIDLVQINPGPIKPIMYRLGEVLDSLAYTLFNNNIQAAQGTNHWIPFTEQEVDAKEAFKSHFMSDYLRGKVNAGAQQNIQAVQQDLFSDAPATEASSRQSNASVTFSPEAQAVMEAGKALWRYYHEQPDAIADAALYDIRLHFQGTNDKGKMNTGSIDAHYTWLMANLRQALKALAQKIEPKVYEYGFLK